MAEQPGVSAPTPVPGTARGPEPASTLAIGLLGGLGLLLLPTGDEYPVRALGPELLVYTIGYALFAPLLWSYLRRWRPRQARAVFAVAMGALLLRVTFCVAATSYAVHRNPAAALTMGPSLSSTQRGLPDRSTSPFQGYIAPDSFAFSRDARTLAWAKTGRLYGLERQLGGHNLNANLIDAMLYRTYGLDAFKRQHYTVLGGTQRIHHVVLAGWAITIVGYSVVASLLPFSFFGVILILITYLYITDLGYPMAAKYILLWMSVAPEFLSISSMWHEDNATAVCVLLVLWAALAQGERWTWRGLWRFIPSYYLLQPFRPQLAPLLGILVALCYGMTWMKSQRARQVYLIFLILAGVAIGLVAVLMNPRSSIGETNYFVGYLINLLANPGPSFFSGLELTSKVYAMADLPIALMYPLLGAWVVLGVGCAIRSGERKWAGVFSGVFVMLGAVTSRYPGVYGAMRLKIVIMPLLVLLAYEALRTVRTWPPRHQRGALGFVALYTVLMWAAHLTLILQRPG